MTVSFPLGSTPAPRLACSYPAALAIEELVRVHRVICLAFMGNEVNIAFLYSFRSVVLQVSLFCHGAFLGGSCSSKMVVNPCHCLDG